MTSLAGGNVDPCSETRAEIQPMRDFFRIGRQKAGIVLLVMAIGLVGMWARSLNTVDACTFVIAYRQQFVFSTHGRIVWLTWSPEMPQLPTLWNSYDIDTDDDDSTPDEADWSISHWGLAVPLTLLSAYLLLWKPRPLTPRKESKDA